MTVTECHKDLTNLPPGGTSLICATKQNGDVCAGDSGGFFGSQSGGSWHIDGLTSLGPCVPMGVSGFTSIGYFRDWISENS